MDRWVGGYVAGQTGEKKGGRGGENLEASGAGVLGFSLLNKILFKHKKVKNNKQS